MTPTPDAAIWRETVDPGWTDYNGHMNLAYYVMVFDHATDVFYDRVGLGEPYIARTNHSVFVVESHVTYDRELKAGDPVRCSCRLIGLDDKRMQTYLEMHHDSDGYRAATTELLTVHVDLAARRVVPFPDDIRDRLAGALDTPPAPGRTGRAIRLASRRG